MGSRGNDGPNPYPQRRATTLFLRVPYGDWTRVKIGEKTEFRTIPRETSRVLAMPLPTLVVGYTVSGIGNYDRTLLMVEDRRHEPLFVIAEDKEALAREGFASYDLFRRYWRARRHGRYLPMEMVWAWRVHPATDEDFEKAGAVLAQRLYGEYR